MANGGRFIYGLDDSYIHLAMARNIAAHGTYGVVPDAFSSASSSPLWTWFLGLLALAFPMNWTEWVPLLAGALTGALSIACIVYAATPGPAERESPVLGPATSYSTRAVVARCLGAAALPPVLGLPTLAIHGMEHGLHMLVTQAFALTAAAVVQYRSRTWPLLLLAAMVPLVRMESLAPVGAAALVLLWVGRWRLALGLLLAATAGIVAQGVYSVAHGEHFLPNSVLVKAWIHTRQVRPTPMAELGDASTSAVAAPMAVTRVLEMVNRLVTRWGPNLGYSAWMLTVFVAALALTAWRAGRRTLDRSRATLVVVFVLTYLAQTFIASGGADFERYQLYLIGLGLTALTALGGDLHGPDGRTRVRLVLAAACTAVLALVTPSFLREASVGASTQQVAHHLRVGEIVARLFPTGSIVIEDLGAIAWIRPAPLLDVYGLASSEIADNLLKGRNNAAALQEVVRRNGAKAAFVRTLSVPLQPAVGVASRPSAWQLVGCLERTVSSDSMVCAWATAPEFVPELRDGLRRLQADQAVGREIQLVGDPGWSPPH